MATKKRSTKKRAPEPEIIFSGVGLVRSRGAKKSLVILRSREEAERSGLSRERAVDLFDPAIAAGGDCSVTFGWFGGVSCKNVSCAGTCTLQFNRMDGQGWIDATEGSLPVNPNWAYRCVC